MILKRLSDTQPLSFYPSFREPFCRPYLLNVMDGYSQMANKKAQPIPDFPEWTVLINSDWSVAYRHFDNNIGAADGSSIRSTSSSIGPTFVDIACTKVLLTGPQTPSASLAHVTNV